MGRNGSIEQKHKGSSSPAERAARVELEDRLGRPLKDSEWTKQRNRLLQFITTLARWDKDQRNTNAASEPEERRRAS